MKMIKNKNESILQTGYSIFEWRLLTLMVTVNDTTNQGGKMDNQKQSEVDCSCVLYHCVEAAM